MYPPKIQDLKLAFLKIQFFMIPLLVGLYPILFFYAQNIEEIPDQPLEILIPLVVIVTVLLLGLARLLFRDKYKAGLFVATIWLLFFSYGHVLAALTKSGMDDPGLDVYLGITWILVLIATGFLLARTSNISDKLINLCSFVTIIMVAGQVWPIIKHEAFLAPKDSYNRLVNNEAIKAYEDNNKRPDIYYIMLDSYPRSDTLKQYFKFNNSKFDSFLKSKGFYIADKTHSNYNQTALSLPAIMNMSYLKDPAPKTYDTTTLLDLYQRNKVLDYVQDRGYKFINNSSLFSTEFNPYADINTGCIQSSEFLKEFADTTALKPFSKIADKTRGSKRSEALCTFENITAHWHVKPKFVFTHLMPPHPPYLFGPNGEDTQDKNVSLSATERWRVTEPYVAQLKYVNKRVSEAVSEILEQSGDNQPIIIIQSDHGTLSQAENAKDPLVDTRRKVLAERSRTYLAIYLPDYCDKSGLYKSMTGVNTFRVVFNGCFGADFEILEDRIYYVGSGIRSTKNFKDITNQVGE